MLKRENIIRRCKNRSYIHCVPWRYYHRWLQKRIWMTLIVDSVAILGLTKEKKKKSKKLSLAGSLCLWWHIPTRQQEHTSPNQGRKLLAYLKRVPTVSSNKPNAINGPFTQERTHSSPQNKTKQKNYTKKDLEETTTAMVDWDKTVCHHSWQQDGAALTKKVVSLRSKLTKTDSKDEEDSDDEDIALSNIDKERTDKISPILG